MGVSTLTLAKKIKQTVLNHPALVERDNTTHVPQSFNFNFGGELEEACTTVRMLIKQIHSAILENSSFTIPEASDDSREAQIARNILFATRAIFTLQNSPRGMLRTSFQNRTYTIDDLEDAVNVSTSDLQALEDMSCFFQFKRHGVDPNNPWTYSWVLLVEGVSVSRGAKQPISKMITSLLKLLPDTVSTTPVIQAAIASLAKMKNPNKAYYWYLSNQNTAMYYHAFETYLSLRSCMSKSYSFYGHTGTRQHPMDCYDDSPHWSMMFISEMSPTEIIEMCDLTIANPSEADQLFKFPFMSRCMVLPTAHECSGRPFETPYVFGKFYGKDKLIDLFYSGGYSEPYHKNNNGLLSGAEHIDGGLIKAIPSTSPDYSKNLLLPYFDKANKAVLVTKDDGLWWESLGIRSPSTLKLPVANCAYEQGSAKFSEVYSEAYGGMYGLGGVYNYDTIDTVFGTDLAEFKHKYVKHTIDGSEIQIPKSLFIDCEGRQVLRGETTSLYDGTYVLTETLVNDPERFKLIGSLGIFDTSIPKHSEVYSRIASLSSTTEGETTDG